MATTFLPPDLSTAAWPKRGDGEIRKTTSPDMVEAVIDVDEEYTEGAMTEFLQRKNRRRGEVYVSEGCVDNYQYLLAGRTVGICDLFLADGAAKIEDFVVAPSMQRQRVGGSLLSYVVGHAREKGASIVYLLTDEGDTAKDMYAKQGFVKVGDSYSLLFLFDEK